MSNFYQIRNKINESYVSAVALKRILFHIYECQKEYFCCFTFSFSFPFFLLLCLNGDKWSNPEIPHQSFHSVIYYGFVRRTHQIFMSLTIQAQTLQNDVESTRTYPVWICFWKIHMIFKIEMRNLNKISSSTWSLRPKDKSLKIYWYNHKFNSPKADLFAETLVRWCQS